MLVSELILELLINQKHHRNIWFLLKMSLMLKIHIYIYIWTKLLETRGCLQFAAPFLRASDATIKPRKEESRHGFLPSTQNTIEKSAFPIRNIPNAGIQKLTTMCHNACVTTSSSYLSNSHNKMTFLCSLSKKKVPQCRLVQQVLIHQSEKNNRAIRQDASVCVMKINQET